MKHILLALALLPLSALHAQEFTLEQCRQQAIAHNRTLESQRIEIDKAEADRKTARMNYFPQLSASAMGFLSAADLIDGKMKLSDEFKQGLGASDYVKGILAQQPEEIQMAFSQLKEMSFSMLDKGAVASLMAIQPLYTGGQIINGNRLARLGVEVARLQYAVSERDLVQNVTEYFWNVQALRGNLKTLDAVDEQLAQVHKEVADYVAAGLTNRSDLLSVELKQQEMATNRLKAESGLKLTEMVLGQLVGADINTFHAADALVDPPKAPADYFVDPLQAVAARPETQLTQRAVEAKRLQVKMERGKCLPSVSIGAVGMYDYMKGDLTTKSNLDARDSKMGTFTMNNFNLMGVATVSVPISDWWSRRHDVHKAKASAVQAELTRLDTEEKLQIDVQSAWNDLTEAYSQIAIARKSVESATENLRLNRDYYKVGQQSMSDLLDAVTTYAQSQSSLIEALATYQTRAANYASKTTK